MAHERSIERYGLWEIVALNSFSYRGHHLEKGDRARIPGNVAWVLSRHRDADFVDSRMDEEDRAADEVARLAVPLAAKDNPAFAVPRREFGHFGMSEKELFLLVAGGLVASRFWVASRPFPFGRLAFFCAALTSSRSKRSTTFDQRRLLDQSAQLNRPLLTIGDLPGGVNAKAGKTGTRKTLPYIVETRGLVPTCAPTQPEQCAILLVSI